jgi:hypothetical protein
MLRSSTRHVAWILTVTVVASDDESERAGRGNVASGLEEPRERCRWIGVDISAFPTTKHLACRDGVCPGNDQSAGNAAAARPARAPSGRARR